MKLFYTLALLFYVYFGYTQTIINAYAKVNSIAGGNILSVVNVNTTNHSFNPGEKVIVMQMQDDVIGTNNANNSSFGNLGTINKAGLYEIATIASVNPSATAPNVITLTAPLSNVFNTGSNSSLQIISFRNLGANYTTTSNLTALPWNGDIGGIIAIEVTNTLTLNHNITADAAGFRGGAISTSAGGSCQPSIFKTNSTSQAYKGEGIYKSTDASHKNGRAKIINGGGGGNEHNGGGAGGGNYTAGGNGGQGWGCASSSGGIGGLDLQTSINTSRFYMGGGGGGGQQNNNVATPGGNGGGIVIIKANTILTGTTCATPYRISANGASATNSGNDGGGGGGAGGSVLLDVTNFLLNASCPLNITANGGNGGNVGNSGTHGGGGGGGQGVLIFTQGMPNSNANINTLSGTGGANSTPGTTFAGSGVGPNNAGVFGNGILPIELLTFDAIKNGNKVDIFWTTLTEIENDFFTIEKSKDGVHFEKVITVDGAGNSNSIINYYESDLQPLKDISYYRLKQTDFNSNETYSKIVAVNYKFSGEGITIFPNPSDGENININLQNFTNKEVLVILRDIEGREHYSKVMLAVENNEIMAIDLEKKLAAGTYIITASSENTLYSQKLIVK